MRWLLVAVPLSIALAFLLHASPLVVFASSIVAIVPLADVIRRATEDLAEHLGAGIGSLLNVTFGNVTEMAIAVFVLLDGQANVVKAQVTGSIIGNGLLGLGLAAMIGGWGRTSQKFNRASAGRLSSLLVLSVIALLLPALFHLTERASTTAAATSRVDEQLALGMSVILLLVYAGNMVYTFVTHRSVFSPPQPEPRDVPASPAWRAVTMLVVATLVLALEAEMVSSALTATAAAIGVSTFFLGIIVLAIVGNAAEYVAAVYFSRADRMSMVMSITLGSSIQMALFVVPCLVLLSWMLGKPMNLVFSNPLELIAIASVAFSVNSIAQDGETTWFEGLLLLGVYALFVLAFLFVAA